MNLFHVLSIFLYPPKCGICNRINKNYICENCYRKLKTKFKINRYCNKYFSKHMYLIKYQGIIREKIIAYKFRDKAYLYKFFLQIIIKNKKVCSFFKSYDIIIPIPINKKRRRKRGYNQTELIAKKIACYIENLKYEKDILIKIKETKPQSTLNKTSRKNNLKGVYEVKNINIIKNKKILLFDDVFTTGSTANECSKILKEAGALKVDILTIAKD